MTTITIPVVLVILGAILLVLGLIGGGIKIKEVELPPLSKVLRITSAVVGLVFIVGGIGLNFIPTSLTPPSSSLITTPLIVHNGGGKEKTGGGAGGSGIGAGSEITTPLIIHNGGYGKGKIKYYPTQENQFNCEVMLQELKPGGVYVLTINGEVNRSGNKELQKYNDSSGEGYWDSSPIEADNSGYIHTQLNVELPESSYDVKFLVKDVKNNWKVILKNDNLRFTIEKIKAQFVVTVTNPQNGSDVGRETTVRGTAVIPGGNHLWVLARRVDFEPLWWPQREVKIDPKTHKWSSTACFGVPEDINWDFHIGVITVNEDGHKELMDCWTNAMKTGDWKPIEIPETTSPLRIIKVKKVSH